MTIFSLNCSRLVFERLGDQSKLYKNEQIASNTTFSLNVARWEMYTDTCAPNKRPICQENCRIPLQFESTYKQLARTG